MPGTMMTPEEMGLSAKDLEMTRIPQTSESEELAQIAKEIQEAGLTQTPESGELAQIAREIQEEGKEDDLAGRLQKFFDKLKPEQIKELFDREHDHSCSCIDERVLKGAVRLPGAGILEGDPQKVAEMLLKAGVKEVLSHEGCGAAAMATRRIDESDPSMPRPAWYSKGDVDGNAERFAQAVVEEMNKMQGEESEEEPAVAAHLSFEKKGMKGDHHRHLAGVIYYDVTKGGFNRHSLEELNLPFGFVVSEHDGSRDENNLLLATEIAFSDHGATHGFDEEKPLAIMVFAQTRAEVDIKVAETKAMILKHVPGHAKEIMVDGVVVPLEPKKPLQN